MRTYSRLLLCAAFLLSTFAALFGQDPVKWTYTVKEIKAGEYDLIFTGHVGDGWYTYSQFQESQDGPVPTSFTFREGPHYQLSGQAKESGEKMTVFDQYFEMNVAKFKHLAVFTQRVKVSDSSKPITGYFTYMTCNDERCNPPEDVNFSFAIPAPATKTDPAPAPSNDPNKSIPAPNQPGQTAATPAVPAVQDTAPGLPATTPTGPAAPDDPDFRGFFNSKRAEIVSARFVNSCGELVETNTSNLAVFFGGFLGGLLALLTPCVFPMIPMTVSFFVKRSKDRRTGLRNAFLYAASIVLIYVGLGVAVTAALGPFILNEMSTDMYFNLLFFAVFVIFALSFFGLFELTLPSSWVNKSDRMADKGGLLGIFFMAFTLALVSFSCTGPIVGTLLVEAAKSNAGASLFGFIPVKPTLGMFGFGLALALPFGLFALFPGWLHSLPKSGGWMDNVKITLGLVELALALKFLSTADMVRHWNLLKFETFLVIWTVLALILGIYQLGLLRWKGAIGRPGLLRATVGMTALAFAGYLGWGLVNYQSLSLLSGLAPPVHYSYRYDNQKDTDGKHKTGCPHGLNCYHDFDEGLAEAKRQNKPLFVDFTGYGCVNCRKMEETVWDKPGVIEQLRDKYVVVSLYVDDQRRLFPDDKFAYLLDPNTGKQMRSEGDKWKQFQANNFHTSSQPYYVLMHTDGVTLLNKPVAFMPEVSEYKAFLDCGYEAFMHLRDNPTKELIGIND